MESTTHKALIVSDYSLDRKGNSVEKDAQHLDVIITYCRSEGHQVMGILNGFARLDVSHTIKDIYFLGNYTNSITFKHHSTRPRFNVHLIPIYGAPFTTFSKFNGDVNMDDVVEPTNIKESLISFIYYGQRPLRDKIVTKLFNNDLLQNTIYHSHHKQPGENIIEKTDSNKEIYHLLPLISDFPYDDGHNDYYPNTIELASKSLFYIISETNADLHDSKFNVLTEKSAVPFFSKTIPVLFTLNSLETLKYLQDLGFDCFTDIISEEVYKIPQDDRIDEVLKIVKNTSLDFYTKNQQRFDKNYEIANLLSKNNLNYVLDGINKIVKDNNLSVHNIV
tara:strand:- start:255 stop:1259 length:1005 start_codon:yes stop_codon:yes gene_type:complete